MDYITKIESILQLQQKCLHPLKKCFWNLFNLNITLNITLKCFGSLFLNVILSCLQFVWHEDELHYIKKLARELNLITLHQKIPLKMFLEYKMLLFMLER